MVDVLVVVRPHREHTIEIAGIDELRRSPSALDRSVDHSRALRLHVVGQLVEPGQRFVELADTEGLQPVHLARTLDLKEERLSLERLTVGGPRTDDGFCEPGTGLESVVAGDDRRIDDESHVGVRDLQLAPIGGSMAQRDLFAQILIDAAVRGERLGMARSLLSERVARYPGARRNWTDYARVLSDLGEDDRAANARERASNVAGDAEKGTSQ